MNLRNISELLSMDDINVRAYLQDIDINILDVIRAARVAPTSQIPLSIALYRELLIFIRNNYFDDEGNFTFTYSSTEDFVWCTEDLVGVIWSSSGIVLLSREQYSGFEDFIGHCRRNEWEWIDGFIEGIPPAPLSSELINYLLNIGILQHDMYTVPENSESLMVKENTSRFSSAAWYEAIQQKVVILAGVGGIGSYVGFLLARFHPKAIFIYDDDKVEAANMSGQLYGKTDIGKYKVDALANMAENYADFGSIFAINQRFTEECEAYDIMICGFDNMAARKLFFNKWKTMVEAKPADQRCHCLFIDGRLAAEELQIFCITGDNDWAMNEYEKYLFSDEEADETICSYKQTTYMANMIGSLISNLFVNFVANELLGFLGRDLPFITQYNGLSMQFKVI